MMSESLPVFFNLGYKFWVAKATLAIPVPRLCPCINQRQKSNMYNLVSTNMFMLLGQIKNNYLVHSFSVVRARRPAPSQSHSVLLLK